MEDNLQLELERLDKKLEAMNSLLMREAVVAFFELSNVLYLVMDEQGKVILVNPAWLQRLGWRTKDMLGRVFMTFVHPEDVHPSRDHFEKALENGEVRGFRNRIRNAESAYEWVEWYGTNSEDLGLVFATASLLEQSSTVPVSFEKSWEGDYLDQQVRGLDRKVLREAIVAFFKISPLLFMICDQEGRILLANWSWTKTFGWKFKELLQKKIFDLIHPGDIDATLEAFENIHRRNATEQGFRNRYVTNTGQYATLDWHGYGSGDGKYVFGVAKLVEKSTWQEETKPE